MMKSKGGEGLPEVFHGVRYAEGLSGIRSGIFAGFRQWECILSRKRLRCWREGLTTVLGR